VFIGGKGCGCGGSGLLGRYSMLLSATGSDDEWECEDMESVASWGLTEGYHGGNCCSETTDEDGGACSSDSNLFTRGQRGQDVFTR
jgi:hypothetical protein